MRSDHRLTVREMADKLNLNSNAAQLILTDNLNMRRVSTKFISKLLPKECRLQMSQGLLHRAENNPDSSTVFQTENFFQMGVI